MIKKKAMEEWSGLMVDLSKECFDKEFSMDLEDMLNKMEK